MCWIHASGRIWLACLAETAFESPVENHPCQHYPCFQVAVYPEAWILLLNCMVKVLVLLSRHIHSCDHWRVVLPPQILNWLLMLCIFSFVTKCSLVLPDEILSQTLSIIVWIVTPCCSCAAIFMLKKDHAENIQNEPSAIQEDCQELTAEAWCSVQNHVFVY